MQVRYWTHQLKFRYPFTISKGTKTHQPTLIVELSLGNWKGYGEAPSISYYPESSLEKMTALLESKKLGIEKFAFTDPERYWHYLHHLIPGSNFLIAALDIAGWDLFGKMKNKSLQSIWGISNQEGPKTDYTIGIDAAAIMAIKMQERDWPIYKIKVGTPDDLNLLSFLRTKSDKLFRVDANAGWTLDEALVLIPKLKELGVELIEQPLAKDNWEGMRILKEMNLIPLFADESCVTEKDVAKCAHYFNGINIKLTKCGGITPAKRMISEARSLGLQVMLGSMNESTIGSAALAQLHPLADALDMDGPLLLEQDVATGLQFDNGRVILSNQAGLGIHFTGVINSEH
ncbi:MAG: dipeptide epimerase [Chitinophagaceae bacterium]|nr:dipeptide epimerase [Chitinophagaceae bacterium]